MIKNSHDKTSILDDSEDSTAYMKIFKKFKDNTVSIVAIVLPVFSIVYVTRILDYFRIFIPNVSYLSLILTLILILGFLLLPIKKGEIKNKLPWYNILFMSLSIIGPIYNFFTWGVNTYRYIYCKFYFFEIALAIITILAVLEITRRAIGPAMPLVATLFILHMFIGNSLPRFLRTPQITISNGVANLMYYDTGIFGIPFRVAASIVILFLIFSQFMIKAGGTNFLFNLSLSIFGHVRGGPAKVAVVSSAFMGMFSGATTANIASTGVFTIPMMKQNGFKPKFAAAVETVASNGGQIMPPIMGMVAFVMAQWIGVSYSKIAIAAILPAILYFYCLFIIIDSRAYQYNIAGIPKQKCPSFFKTMKEGWFFIIPIITLIFFIIILKYSPELSILYSLIALFLVKGVEHILTSTNKKDKLPRLCIFNNVYKNLMAPLREAGISFITPAICTACCGIIIGTLSVTQLGTVLTSFAVKIGSEHLIFLLLISAFACFILGMGMSSLPAYIMTVIVVAPALLDFGVQPIVAHFFVFWFSIISFITPPVAIGAYVAASIANADPIKTGFTAMKLGIIEFILPFLFIFRPSYLLQGTTREIIYTILFSLLGSTILSNGLGTYFFGKLNNPQRLLLIVGGISIMLVNFKGIIFGLFLSLLVITWQYTKKSLYKTQN